MIFRNPIILFLIPIFLVLFFFLRKKYREPAFLFPSDGIIKTLKGSLRLIFAGKVIYFRVCCIVFLIIAMARPQISKEYRMKKEGIGIVLAIDCSSTMLAEDLELSGSGLDRLIKIGDEKSKRPNRLDAVLEVARNFVGKRPNDWIGIIAFASDAYMVCPLTFDHKWILESLKRVKIGMIKDGTAIGSGILSSIKSLKDLKAKSKVIILLTDGINNSGQTPPLVAAKAARSLGIKIYTIGIVSRGQTPYPTKDMYGRKVYKNVKIDINEDMLKKMAELTGGRYFRANNMESLRRSYDDINKLEKTEIEEMLYAQHRDIFSSFILMALFCLLLGMILENTFLRRIP